MSRHPIVTGLSAWGFHATCPCGWRTTRPSWDREAVARAGNDHTCDVHQGDGVMSKHTIITGLSAWGFHATCPCGWRTARPSWDREAVATAGDDHKIRQRLGSAS
jgi:hypothetical protein